MLNIENLQLMLKCKNTSTYILNKQKNVLNNYFISKTNTSNLYVCYKQKNKMLNL